MGTEQQIPLAIVGMACHVPGADGLEAFWRLLVEGHCAIGQVPEERLDPALYYDPRRGQRSKSYTRLGGLIDYPPFDATICPVPSTILPSAELGHREICRIATLACRHAGMDPFDLPLRNVGVYLGHNLGGPLAGELIYASLVRQTALYLNEIDHFGTLLGERQQSVINELVHQIRSTLPRRGSDGGRAARR